MKRGRMGKTEGREEREGREEGGREKRERIL